MRIKMPAVRIAQADVDMQQDTDVLTCGACQKAFALGDIVKFIQHKVLACNKENYSCNDTGNNNGESGDSDGEDGVVVRRPSISAPMKRSEEPRCSTPKRRATPGSASPTPIKAELDSSLPVSSPDEGPCKKLRTEVVDAQSNTTNSEPNNYVCSTCKARLHSAWRLVQHVQNSHGIKIYVEGSSTGSTSSLGSSPGTSVGKNHSTSSTCSSSPGCSGAPPTTPLSLPPPAAPVTSSRLPSPLIDPHLPLHNPFTVGGLLRMPLEPTRHHQFTPSSLSGSGGSMFARPSSHNEHHFRMEQLVSEQFRHHPLGLAAAAVAAAVPPPHFGPPPTERPPPTSRSLPPPPSLPLSLEPQIDFYSQRLRQLAGTTSPGAANGNSSPSPRKLTPPFTSPNSNIPTSVSIAPSLMFNNNNNSSTNNNNITTSATRSPTPRPLTNSPNLELKTPQVSDSPPQETVDLTSTPRSASTPPNKQDFSGNQASESMDVSDPNRIHSCDYCGKKFRFQSNLLVHRRSHTGEKPYKCSVCNHACSQSSKLKRHMKVHKRSRNKNSEGGNANGSGSVNTTPDQMSNAGSVETLDDEDEDDEEEIDEEDDEEEDEEEEEEMELEEEEGDEDDDLGGDAPEDLTTKSTSSTPPTTDNNKGGAGSPLPDKINSSGSLVGELMDKFGLSNIQQYSEAYKAALQESVGGHHLISRKDEILQRSHLIADNNNVGSKPSPTSRLENGLLEKSAALRFREEFAKNIITGQPQLDLVGGHHGIFGPSFENPFEASKRVKLEGREMGRHGERDMYAGLWFPGLSHPRDQMFGTNGSDSDKDKVKVPAGAGTSLAAAAAAAAALNLGIPTQNMKKDSRRNDTCEFCGKVFKNCSNLTVHRRSHTGEKPYKCELCSYACAQSSKLTRHMKTHGRMGKDVYRCRFCEMPFSVPSTLEKHMRKCVVNQNIKVEHMLPSIMSGDEDSAASTPKDTAST
ncbi:B-cell lymphoma/leukemia 11A-like [Halyomorpha halys]|uniref:B-cell lymphoma/leukemia 11A-like n=1 Tax=Halyomorpha halys TaxID=286706 RepID=UPI0034D36B2B